MHVSFPMLLLLFLPSWIVSSLLPLLLPALSGFVTTALHNYWVKGTSWYASASCPTAVHVAIAFLIGTGTTLGGAFLHGIMGGDAVSASCAGTAAASSADCVTALGGLLTSGSITLLLTWLLPVGGVLAVKQDQIHATMKAALRASLGTHQK